MNVLIPLLVMQIPVLPPATRLRTILPNRAVVQVERVEGASGVVASMWFATPQDKAGNNRFRHLLEHLVAKGQKGDIDQRVETAGGLLTASTYRDAMCFEIRCPKSSLPTALKALRDITSTRLYTADEIAHECDVIAQESATRTAYDRMSVAAWNEAYGDGGTDPFGVVDDMRSCSPTALSSLAASTFVANHASLVVVGDVDVDATSKAAAGVLVGLPASKKASSTRALGKPGHAMVDAPGFATAAIVPGIQNTPSIAALMAGLALASSLDDGAFTYTPTAANGLMIVSGPDQTQSDALTYAKAENLIGIGRILARKWIRRYLESADGIAYIRGILGCQDPGLNPENLLELVDSIDMAQFKEALAKYRRPQALEVTGQ